MRDNAGPLELLSPISIDKKVSSVVTVDKPPEAKGTAEEWKIRGRKESAKLLSVVLGMTRNTIKLRKETCGNLGAARVVEGRGNWGGREGNRRERKARFGPGRRGLLKNGREVISHR